MQSEISWIFLIIWMLLLISFMSVGGYFMFRKFFKVLPMADGKSKLDWQNYYVEQSRHLWTNESRAFLDQLVSPVPKPFRDVARHSIAAKIGEVALKEKAAEVTRDHCVKGYILATPKRDHRSLMDFLDKNNIDYSRYRDLLK